MPRFRDPFRPRTLIYLEEDLRWEIRAAAVRERVTMQAWITAAIVERLAREAGEKAAREGQAVPA